MVLMVAVMQLLCGTTLIYVAFHYRDAPAATWWGASHIVLAAGVVLSMVSGITGDDRLAALAFVVFLICAAMQWHGTRLLTGARPYLPLILVGPVLVAAVNLLPVGSSLPGIRGITASVLNIAYFTGALVVLLRPPAGSLAAHKPLAVLFVANIIAIGLGPFGGLGSTRGRAASPPQYRWVHLSRGPGLRDRHHHLRRGRRPRAQGIPESQRRRDRRSDRPGQPPQLLRACRRSRQAQPDYGNAVRRDDDRSR